MSIVAVILGLIALAGVVVTVLARRSLANTSKQLAEVTTASQAHAATAADLLSELTSERTSRADAEERAKVADAAMREAADIARGAVVRADESDAASTEAREEAERARHRRLAAEDRAAAAERRAREIARVQAESAGVSDAIAWSDPAVLWALERARSERTWRHDVASGPDVDSPIVDDALSAALGVAAEAARETVGTVVTTEIGLPVELGADGSLMVLRAAQELLEDVIRHAESVTLRVASDGDDIVVAVDALDAEGASVETLPLAIPMSDRVVAVDGGVRLVGLLAERVGESPNASPKGA